MVEKESVFIVSLFAFVILVSLGTMVGVSAYVNSTSLTINASNGASGSDWFKGGSNKSINFTISVTPWNSTTYLKYFNISAPAGFTFWTGGGQTNETGNLTCGNFNTSMLNCTATTINAPFIANLTVNMTMNATALEQNHTLTFNFLTNGTATANSTTFSLEVDGVTPTITTPFYAWWRNTTSIKTSTTSQLTLNISVSDSGSGGSSCYTNINGTNQTFSVSSGWCNFTVGNLTGLSDGNQTLKLYINDSVNNLVLNSSLVLQMDTTNPIVTHACTPEPVVQGDTLTCTCTVTDATSGVNTSATTHTASPSTADTGEYTTQCTASDYGGNSVTTTVTYNVGGASSSSSSGGGGGGGSATYWTAGTHTVTEEAFGSDGYTGDFSSRQRARIPVAGGGHYIGVKSVTQTTATIEIASTPQEATMTVGEERKFDLDGDGYYDLSVTLNSVAGGKANLTMVSISEPVTEEAAAGEATKEEAAQEVLKEETGTAETSTGGKYTLWIIIVVVIILIILGSRMARSSSSGKRRR